jgi:outer membrane receptor protein involved in Fe transport
MLIWSACALLTAWAQSPPPPADPQPIETVHSSITVTERLTAETPAAISVLDDKQIQQTPGVNLDDRLRMVPGFSPFAGPRVWLLIRRRKESRCAALARPARAARSCSGMVSR